MIKTTKLTLLLASAIPLTSLYTTAHAQSTTIKDGEHLIVDQYWDLGARKVMSVGTNTDGELTVKDNGHVKLSLIQLGIGGGNGVVNVLNGGQIQVNNDNSYAYPLAIGGKGDSSNVAQGSTGTLNIIGTGSKVYLDPTSLYGRGEVSVGSSGAHGILNIQDGGQFIIDHVQSDGVWIGSRGSATTKGVVNVDGDGSLLFSSGRILVGTYNEGQLNVTNGAQVKTDSYISVGRAVSDSSADNVLFVSGAGSHVEAASYVDVGYQGSGAIIVADEGKLTASKVTVASRSGMAGELAIGGRAGQAATAAGTLDTALVEFGQGNGRVVFNHTNADYDFAPAMTGKGAVDFLSGVTTLTGANTYTGVTTVDAATLRAGGLNTLSANSDYTVQSAGQIDLDGYDQTLKSLTNAGAIYFGQSAMTAGTQLDITGDYIGQNGSIIMNAVLSDDTSLSDRLNIAGNATGTTYVQVNNLGGTGAQTLEGLQLIAVGGTSDSHAFEQQGRIVAGAYDYHLVKGDVSQTDPESWYLTSEYNATGGQGGGAEVRRPEGGAYLSNLAAANTLFNLRLHDRQGEQMTYLSPDGRTDSFAPWVRFNYKHENFKDDSQQLSTKGHGNVIQVGADLIQLGDAKAGQVNIGVMGGYGQYSGDNKNKLNNYTASAKLKGYHAGVYGTWYAHPEQEGGAYVDSWLMWNQFNADVNGEGQRQENYHLKGVTASVEAGYAVNAGQLKGYNLWVEPQAQLTWMGVKADEHTEVNGTRVKGQGDNLQTRAGAKFYISSQNSTSTTVPYVEANWIHNTKPFSVEMDGVRVRQGNTRNIAELKAGVQTKLNNNTLMWLDVGQQFGSDTYKNTQLRLGLKYTF